MPKRVKDARAIAHKGTRVRKVPKFGSHGDSLPFCEIDDPCPIGDLDCILRSHDGLGAELRRGFEAFFNIAGGTQLKRLELNT